MKISVITINYNGISNTRIFITSFKKEVQGVDYELLVVDNASVENEARMLEEEFGDIVCIRSDINLGFSGGNNLGVKYAKGEMLLFMNNDIIVKSNFLSPLLERLSQNMNIGAISPQIRYMDETLCYGGCKPIGRFLLRIHYLSGDLDKGLSFSQEVSLIHGAVVMIRKNVLEKIGGWPDIYFLYSEEIDLSLSLKKLGYSVWYEPKSLVYHLGSQSTGKDSPLVYYYNTRNRLLLYKRNLCGITRVVSITYQLLLNYYHIFLLLLSSKQLLAKSVFLGTKDFLMNKFYFRSDV